jgi:hypothetical protein
MDSIDGLLRLAPGIGVGLGLAIFLLVEKQKEHRL